MRQSDICGMEQEWENIFAAGRPPGTVSDNELLAVVCVWCGIDQIWVALRCVQPVRAGIAQYTAANQLCRQCRDDRM